MSIVRVRRTQIQNVVIVEFNKALHTKGAKNIKELWKCKESR